MQPVYEVADVVRRVVLDDAMFTVHQQKTLRALSVCRTSALGGHVDACDACGHIRVSYNSCRNRHCPKCQGHKREEWIQKRGGELLPCSYYHVVFTLPDTLHGLALQRPKLVYDILLSSAWSTLDQFGKTKGMHLGMIGVLHTWGQNMGLHPHLHCIVPGGGVDRDGTWRKQVGRKKFLFAVKALSRVFRARYVSALRRAGISDSSLLDSLFAKDWVVYAKRPFGGPRQVIEYLGRYTHKVAISNHRIKEVTPTHTSFGYKDYRMAGIRKTMILSNEEFVRRFSLHILPHRFVRIRHYGILSNSWKRGKLQQLQDTLSVIRQDTQVETWLRRCPCCKQGTLVTIELLPTRGPPKVDLRVAQTVPMA